MFLSELFIKKNNKEQPKGGFKIRLNLTFLCTGRAEQSLGLMYNPRIIPNF